MTLKGKVIISCQMWRTKFVTTPLLFTSTIAKGHVKLIGLRNLWLSTTGTTIQRVVVAWQFATSRPSEETFERMWWRSLDAMMQSLISTSLKHHRYGHLEELGAILEEGKKARNPS